MSSLVDISVVVVTAFLLLALYRYFFHKHKSRVQPETEITNQLELGCYGKNFPSTNEKGIDKVLSDIEQIISENQGFPDLAEHISMKSVSGDPNFKEDCLKSLNFAKKILESAKFDVTLESFDKENDMLPVVLAKLGNDRQKKTVLFYCHVDISGEGIGADHGGWNSDPFKKTFKNGKVFGRGVANGKGPFHAIILAIKAYQKNSMEFPVNIKVCVDAEKEFGSPGLNRLFNGKNTFFDNIDFSCLMEGSGKQPALGIGSRGICTFELEIQSSKHDLHSGIYGGAIPEAMTDLSFLLAGVVDSSGRALIPGFNQGGVLENDSPILSIHGIQGAFDGPNEKTVIPGTVIGMFSIRLSRSQKTDIVVKQVWKHLTNLWNQLKSPNKIDLRCTSAFETVDFSSNSRSLKAASKAVEQIYGTAPEFIRMSETVPIAPWIDNRMSGNVVAMMFAAEDSNIFTSDENISLELAIKKTKQIAVFLKNLATA